MKIKNISTQDLIIPMKKSNGDKLMVKLQPGEFVYSEATRVGDNKQLIVWTRKKAIDVTEDAKPEKCEYCKAYKPLPAGMSKAALSAPAPIVFDEDVDEEEDTIVIPEIKVDKNAEELTSSPEDFWIDEDEDEDSNKKKPKKKKTTNESEEDDDDDDDEDLDDDDDDDDDDEDEDSDDDSAEESKSSDTTDTTVPQKHKGGRPKGVKNKDKRGRKKVKKPRGRPTKKKKVKLDTDNSSEQ